MLGHAAWRVVSGQAKRAVMIGQRGGTGRTEALIAAFALCTTRGAGFTIILKATKRSQAEAAMCRRARCLRRNILG